MDPAASRQYVVQACRTHFFLSPHPCHMRRPSHFPSLAPSPQQQQQQQLRFPSVYRPHNNASQHNTTRHARSVTVLKFTNSLCTSNCRPFSWNKLQPQATNQAITCHMSRNLTRNVATLVAIASHWATLFCHSNYKFAIWREKTNKMQQLDVYYHFYTVQENKIQSQTANYLH